MFKDTIFFKKQQQLLSNYITSIINSVNFYQLPYYSGVCIKFPFNTKHKGTILAYISFFKYFFNKKPKIKMESSIQNKKNPNYLIIEFKGRDCLFFFLYILISYQKEQIVSKDISTKLIPLYRGNSCTLVLSNFFLLNDIMKLLLLYKNEGLMFNETSNLISLLKFRSHTNIWNWYYFKFLLKSFI